MGGFGKEAKEVKVILGKCKGGGVEIIDFFSIDCDMSMIYIHSFRGDFKLANFYFYFL